MNYKIIGLAVLAISVSACSTYTTPRYAINADTNLALKELGTTGLSVGAFAAPTNFSESCRAAGPLAPPDGMSHTDYIRKALESELKVAGIYTTSNPRVILSGYVKKLEFSSSRGLTGGSWDIEVLLNSSNGKTQMVAEHYEFESGFSAITACKQTAEAYFPAVQNLIAKAVRSPEFKALLQ
ncbi:hypothetical protein [uncultured Propionivibrio sp.]|uniref:hypothetical protein n=1 Tax=uncultured Propionivibrio sp. TaxID=426737 RepID=UPI0029BFCB0B|nr:hypothetical protein [uncultured Propionivibrio sp.]